MESKQMHYRNSSQDLMNYITRANADQQLHGIISVRGRLDEHTLQSAMRIAMDREPVLGCRFVQQDNHTGWERRSDLDRLDLCPLIHPADLRGELKAFVTTPADPCRDPLIQARLFRTTAGDTFCLKVNHVAADGAGTKEIVYLVADTYTRLVADPSYRPGLSRPGKRSQLGLFRQAGLKNLFKYRPRKLGLPSGGRFSLPFHGSEPDGRAFALRQVDPDTFRMLKAYGKRQGATINDLILAALYKALFSVAETPQSTALPVQVSIDLRRALPFHQPQPICNLSGALFPAIPYRPGASYEKILSDVQAQMKRWKSGRPGLTGAMLIELAMLQGFHKANAMLGQMTAVRSNQVNPLLLSNFGLMDESRLVFGSAEIVDAYLLGPVMFKRGLMLTASTYADRLTLAIGYCQGCISASVIEAILEQVWVELRQAGEYVGDEAPACQLIGW